jgi:hypothetical protein
MFFGKRLDLSTIASNSTKYLKSMQCTDSQLFLFENKSSGNVNLLPNLFNPYVNHVSGMCLSLVNTPV